MTRNIHIILIVFALVFAGYFGSYAKRGPAPEVAPVVHNGIRYVAPNSSGEIGILEAWDMKSNVRLWQKEIYRIDINPANEKDVQWLFIQDLAIENSNIIITREDGRPYSIETDK